MIQLLNGLQLAMLLFLLSVGLSIVLGLMNFINLAHGTLYMLGAYFGLTVVSATGLVLAGPPIGAIGDGDRRNGALPISAAQAKRRQSAAANPPDIWRHLCRRRDHPDHLGQ